MARLLPPLRAGGILGGFLSLSSGEIAARAIAFIGTAYLTRVLGPEGFGVVGLAAALCGYLALAVTAGYGDVGSRDIARQPDRAAAIAAGATVVRLGLAAGAFAAAALLALLLPKPPVVRLVVLLTGLSFFTLALDTSWVYKGLERTRRVAVALVVGQAVFVTLVLAGVRGPDDVVWVPLAQVGGELVGAALLLVPLLRRGVRPDLREGWSILRESGFVTLSRLFRTLIYTFDVVLIGLLLTERDVGLYSAAYRFCFLLLAVGAAMHVAYLPAFARARSRLERELLAGRSAHLALALAAPMVVGGALLARPLLDTAFGAGYGAAAAPFALLLMGLGCTLVNGTVHNVVLVLGLTRQETRVIGLGAALNVALNLVAIPRYGLLGAAAATAVSEACVLVMGLGLVARHGLRVRGAPWFRTGLAGGVMGAGLVLAGGGAPLPALIGGGAVLYGGVLALLRAIPADVVAALRPPSGTGPPRA